MSLTEQKFLEELCKLFMVLNNDVDYGHEIDPIIERIHDLIHRWEHNGDTDTE